MPESGGWEVQYPEPRPVLIRGPENKAPGFAFEKAENPSCATCLTPFDYDFSELTGLTTCAAPSRPTAMP